MNKRIIFMGTSSFAVPILKSLHQNNYLIDTIYTQPPSKAQRGQKIRKSPIQSIAEKLGINCRFPSSLKNNAQEYEYIKSIYVHVMYHNCCHCICKWRMYVYT